MAAALLFEDKVTVNRSAFTAKVRRIAASLNMNPDWIMSVINFETSGTFSPTIRNPNSSAIGLIQFLSSTLQDLGYTTAQVAAMDNVAQLDVVEKYYRKRISQYGTIDNVTEAYLAVFYPAAIPWAMDRVFPDNVYRVNSLFDEDKNGQITKQEIQNKILSTIPGQYKLSVSEKRFYMNRSVFIIGIFLLLIGVYLMWAFKKF